MRLCRYAALSLLAVSASFAADSDRLWEEYEANPDTHLLIPNCSYAGYRAGESALPEPKVVANVKDEGAKADGKTDDAPAFAAAIEKAHAAGGGAVLVPAGTYRLDDIVRIKYDNVVLRGAGAGKTILKYDKSLSDMMGKITYNKLTQWSWAGGVVWIGPGSVFDESGKLSNSNWQEWEEWAPGEVLAEVNGSAKVGDRVIEVSSASNIKPGDYVILAWTPDSDHTLLDEIGGHEKMKEWDWSRATWINNKPYLWPVRVAAVKGTSVELAQPLRIAIEPKWSVKVQSVGPTVRESGVEKLTIQFPPHKLPGHNQYVGYNGIYFTRAINCFARDVAVENADNGLIHASAKHTTVSGFNLRGSDNHHATALRCMSADNLIERFVIESKPMHGINMEWLGSGNVWREGTMKNGTFDSHGGLSFDNLRTNITVANTGKPGGAKQAGPFLGKRTTTWNVRITNGNAEFIHQPEQFTMSALVGIQGAPVKPDVSFNMPAGDKGTVVADPGKRPKIDDLYEAQLKLRLKK